MLVPWERDALAMAAVLLSLGLDYRHPTAAGTNLCREAQQASPSCLRVYTAAWGKGLHTKLSLVLRRTACSLAMANLLMDLAPDLCNWNNSMSTT